MLRSLKSMKPGGQVHRFTFANLQSLAAERVKEGTAHLLLGFAYTLSTCCDKSWPNKKNKQAAQMRLAF